MTCERCSELEKKLARVTGALKDTVDAMIIVRNDVERWGGNGHKTYVIVKDTIAMARCIIDKVGKSNG